MRTFDLINSKQKFNYEIADDCYQFNTFLPELEHLLQNQATHQIKTQQIIPSKKTCLYNQLTHVGENQYQLKCEYDTNGCYYISVKNQKYTICKNNIKSKSKHTDVTMALGPVLIVNLAINHVFCLHASAFLIRDKLFIVMAESGTGKSTIAAFMDKQKQAKRVADDILPLTIIDNNLRVLPHFPQLKLPQCNQYVGEDIVTQTVLIFAKKSKKKSALKEIDKFSTLKKVIQHSVATKLFAENELNKHLQFCHNISTYCQSYQLDYQHSTDSLKNLYSRLYEI